MAKAVTIKRPDERVPEGVDPVAPVLDIPSDAETGREIER